MLIEGFEVLTALVMSILHIFWDIKMCSPLKLNRHVVSSLKMEAICSSETSVNFERTTRLYNPEDNILADLSLIDLYRSTALHDHVSLVFSNSEVPRLMHINFNQHLYI
jgi:hypothetical protein